MTVESRGAHWIRAALQVNPYEYHGRNAPKTFFESEADYNRALLDECDVLGVSLIAVTDHWSVDSSAGLVAAARARGIVALPGFEANSSEGVHILVIFEEGTDYSVINAAIGRCGGTPNGEPGTTGESYAVIMQRMSDDGALVIPAHVNVNPAGLLTTRSGQPLATMILCEQLHAIGISPGAQEARDQEAVVAGTGLFARRHPLAVVHADDVMGPRQLRTAGATSWFKVSSRSARSLKLAVRTPETRISLQDPAVLPRPTLRRISWVGGYLDGVDLPISNDLTALIGGRGAGKSTVIESIRYVLGIEAISPQAQADHASLVQDVLRSGTIVRLEVETTTPQRQRFTIEREVPHPPTVLDAQGARTDLLPAQVIGPVEIFGQHELAELAGKAERVAELVRRFSGDTGDDEEREQLLRDLKRNRDDLHRTEAEIARLEEDMARSGGLEEQVAHYEGTDVPTKLAGQQRLELDRATFDESLKRIEAASGALKLFERSHTIDALNVDYAELDESPQAEHLAKARLATNELHDVLTKAIGEMTDAIDAAKRSIDLAKGDWERTTAEESAGYGEVLRDLHERGLDPDKYVQIKADLGLLKATVPRREQLGTELEQLLAARAAKLAELRALETRSTEQLHASIAAANSVTEGVVVVRPVPAGERAHLHATIKSHVSGQRFQISAAIDKADFSPRVLAAAIRTNLKALEELGIRGAQAAGLMGAGEAVARELDEQHVPLAVEVLLRVDGTGLRSMSQLSKGQRATALLLLLLGASSAPLIIDQPEDDLDNNFVYTGVVARLRKLKGARQIIASTHNANVPVLGDAELIVVLESDGNRGAPVADGIGSLDDAAIRTLAENILEGGPAAFNARQHLYGF